MDKHGIQNIFFYFFSWSEKEPNAGVGKNISPEDIHEWQQECSGCRARVRGIEANRLEAHITVYTAAH